MKLNLILILFLSVITVFAQDEKQNNPNVELPDFVITGTSKVNLKKVDKIKPDFISTVSEEFLKPSYSPEELEIGDFSNPIKTDLSFLDEVNYFKGNISAGIGFYTIPTVGINYAQPFTNGIVEGMFNGRFDRAYEDNSDKYKTRAGFNLLYWTDIEGEFLPGTQFNLNGNYGTTSFKFFASDNPKERRSLNYGKIEASVKNDFNRNLLLNLSFSDNMYNISQEPFSENNFRLKGETLIKLDAFNLGISAVYKSHILKNISGNNSGKDFLQLRPTAGFQFTELIKGSFGWTFSRGAGNTFNALYGSVALKLNKNVTLFGEYAPVAMFESSGELLLKNNYLIVDSLGSIYWEKKNSFTASLKYEFDKYFQIDGGFNYFSSENYPFFVEAFEKGKYNLRYIKVNSISPFVNFLFYVGPSGEFYGSLKFLDITDNNDNIIPFTPKFEINAAYSYRFSPEFKGVVKMCYLSKRYSDIENTISIGDYVDLGASVIYTFNPDLDLTLDLNNILNHKNYFWNGYKEIPANVILGINYRL